MILTLYGFLLCIGLILVIIGLIKPNESAQALIGFFFLFLLSFPLMSGEVEYKTGENTTTTYAYVSGNLTSTEEVLKHSYTPFNDNLSRRFGLYLAIASAVGFAGVLYGIGRTNWREE